MSHIRQTEFVHLFAPRFRFEKGPWLGVAGSWRWKEDATGSVTPMAGDAPQGFLVTRSMIGSPAHAAGVRAGDLLLSLGGTRLDGSTPLSEILDQSVPDGPQELTLQRDGETVSLKVRIAMQP